MVTNSEESKLCPSCITEFLKNHNVSELGSEPEDLRNGTKLWLCEKHKERNLFQEINYARELTESDEK